MRRDEIFASLEIPAAAYSSGDIISYSPNDGTEIGRVAADDATMTANKIARASAAFKEWRVVPAPRRGELIRQYGEELRRHKQALGALVSLEAGKITSEGLGEIQEMIDICDFAVGLSRQLYGLTIASERPGHRMSEIWQPLGVVGCITAFNFPVAVWCWNFALAIVCGDPVVWKPSEKTPLTALACQHLFERVAKKFGAPDGLSLVVQGLRAVGEQLVDDPRIALVSATGSTRMGREVAPKVAQRFGRVLLELGGNNAMIVTPSADLELAVRAILFAAVGTCGQRCTSLRRLIVHNSVKDKLLPRLKAAYEKIRIGNPMTDNDVLLGPLVDKAAFDAMQAAIAQAKKDGGVVFGGERALAERFEGAYYVTPAIIEMPMQSEIVRHETFAPLLYVLGYEKWEEAIAMHNDVPQGLSSCIFTTDIREAEQFLSPAGSDCGIVNINIGPSGAEIGGAFGGEKETGGGRESGSDSWKSYMRRVTSTVNYSNQLPLAQGVVFDAA